MEPDDIKGRIPDELQESYEIREDIRDDEKW